MPAPFDNADSARCRPDREPDVLLLRALPTVNPGDDDEEDDDGGPRDGGGSIDPEPDEGYDGEDEDDEDEDPLWAGRCAAAHQRTVKRGLGRVRGTVRAVSRNGHTSRPRSRNRGARPA